MKNTFAMLLAVLSLTVLAVIGCVLLGVSDAAMVLVLPFSLIGKALRALSLAGSMGNIAAIALYVPLCLLPLLPLLRGKRKTEDLLLILCSGMMFCTVYYMINPTLRPDALQSSTGDLILCGAVYSILLGWVVIRLLRCCGELETGSVYRALRIFVFLCIAEFAVALAAELSSSLTAINDVRSANTMPDVNLIPTYVFIFLSFAVTALEYGLVIIVLLQSVGLLRELEADPYGEGCCLACEKTAAWCRRTLVIVTLSSMALNIAQVLFIPVLLSVNVRFRLPVLSIAVAFALLALSRLLNKGKKIKETNDLFI